REKEFAGVGARCDAGWDSTLNCAGVRWQWSCAARPMPGGGARQTNVITKLNKYRRCIGSSAESLSRARIRTTEEGEKLIDRGVPRGRLSPAVSRLDQPHGTTFCHQQLRARSDPGPSGGYRASGAAP